MNRVNETGNKGYDVFISYYSLTGKDFARCLKRGLKDFSINAFLDEEDIPKSVKTETDEWRSWIDRSLRNSSVFFLIMTAGFSTRQEVLRELKIAFQSKLKMYFLKHEDLIATDLSVKIDDKVIDLSRYEYVPFSNESDLLRKAVTSLLGKLGQEKKSFFRVEAKSMIASEDFKNMSVSINGIVIAGHLIEMFEGYIGGLILKGKALEDEGKKICDGLKAYKKGDVVQIKDSYKFEKSGIYEIERIDCSVDATKAPAIYSFYLEFKNK